MNKEFCTYLTIYSGDKLPPYYIGSTSKTKIENGYYGSVRSIQYKDIWENELAQNIHLFDIIILSEHYTREEALAQELIYQEKQNVVMNEEFINLSFARINGHFGRDTSGANHWNYGGKKFSKEDKQLVRELRNSGLIYKEIIKHFNELGKTISLSSIKKFLMINNL